MHDWLYSWVIPCDVTINSGAGIWAGLWLLPQLVGNPVESGGLSTALLGEICIIILDCVPILDREVFPSHPGEGEVSS